MRDASMPQSSVVVSKTASYVNSPKNKIPPNQFFDSPKYQRNPTNTGQDTSGTETGKRNQIDELFQNSIDNANRIIN